MTTAYRPADARVFGPHRGGVFLPPSILGAPTDPAWCASCSGHRVERAGNLCPACREESQ